MICLLYTLVASTSLLAFRLYFPSPQPVATVVAPPPTYCVTIRVVIESYDRICMSIFECERECVTFFECECECFEFAFECAFECLLVAYKIFDCSHAHSYVFASLHGVANSTYLDLGRLPFLCLLL